MKLTQEEMLKGNKVHLIAKIGSAAQVLCAAQVLFIQGPLDCIARGFFAACHIPLLGLTRPLERLQQSSNTEDDCNKGARWCLKLGSVNITSLLQIGL